MMDILNILEITLLTKEEYKQYKEHIPYIDNTWWLKSIFHGDTSRAGMIDETGSLIFERVDTIAGVRPVLKISTSRPIGSKIKYNDIPLTIINRDLAICDNIIGNSPFCSKWDSYGANLYDKSDVKGMVDNFF